MITNGKIRLYCDNGMYKARWWLDEVRVKPIKKGLLYILNVTKGMSWITLDKTFKASTKTVAQLLPQGGTAAAIFICMKHCMVENHQITH